MRLTHTKIPTPHNNPINPNNPIRLNNQNIANQQFLLTNLLLLPITFNDDALIFVLAFVLVHLMVLDAYFCLEEDHCD